MLFNKFITRGFTKTPTSRLRYNKVQDLLENAASGSDRTPKNKDDVWSTSPYTDGAVFNNKRDQSKKTKRSPPDASIVLFPGQGSGYVGMAKNLVRIPEARDIFEIASQVLG